MNILRQIVFLLSFLSLSIASAQIFTPAADVRNPLFIFDVGSVLVRISQLSNTGGYFNLLKKSYKDRKASLLKLSAWCAWNGLTLSSMNNQGPEDRVIDYIAESNPILNEYMDANNTLADLIKEVICRATPLKKSQKIVKNLIKKGYPVALGTNKGKNTITRLIKSKALADYNYVTIFTCDSHSEADKGIFYKKPSITYYENLLKDLHSKGFVNNSFIFIDNNLENVKAASEVGMIGILYTTPEQLIEDLQHLGIAL